MSRRWLSIDWVGNVLALGMTTSLILALQWGGSVFAWDDRIIITLFILVSLPPIPRVIQSHLVVPLCRPSQAGILLGLFLCWELYIAQNGHPMVPLTLLQNPSVSGAALSGFFVHILFGVASAYLPLFYQSRGASALQSGIDILPFMASSVGFVVLAGLAVKRIGYYKVWIVLGPWIAAVGAGLLTDGDLLRPELLIGWQIIIGSGFGMAFQNTGAWRHWPKNFPIVHLTKFICVSVCSHGGSGGVCA